MSLNCDSPKGWTVQQIPLSLPPLYNGDRLVVYGLMKPTKKDIQVGQTVVRLQGTLTNGIKVEHVITFPTPSKAIAADTVCDPNSSAILHGLAAKSLIQVKKDELNDRSCVELEDGQSAIISVSKSANVVSKYPSFVAVDKENHEPVSGPLTKRMVPLVNSSPLYCSARPMSSLEKLRERFLGVNSGRLRYSAPPMLRSRPKKPPERFQRLKSFGGCDQQMYDGVYDDVYEEMERGLSTVEGLSLAAGLCEGGSSTLMDPSGPLFLSLISLQQASGAWDLTDKLLALCKVSKDAVITG